MRFIPKKKKLNKIKKQQKKYDEKIAKQNAQLENDVNELNEILGLFGITKKVEIV